MRPGSSRKPFSAFTCSPVASCAPTAALGAHQEPRHARDAGIRCNFLAQRYDFQALDLWNAPQPQDRSASRR